MKIYLDACALNRLTDDPTQDRIRIEAEAVEAIFRHIESGAIGWVTSSILEMEVLRNPDLERRFETLELLSFATETFVPSAMTTARAKQLESLGFGAFDAFHLACAEEAAVNIFITTDDRLIRRANRAMGGVSVRVASPVELLRVWRP